MDNKLPDKNPQDEFLVNLLEKRKGNLCTKQAKKSFNQKLKRTAGKVKKFAERTLTSSGLRKSGYATDALDKTGSADEFCDQVGVTILNIGFVLRKTGIVLSLIKPN